MENKLVSDFLKLDRSPVWPIFSLWQTECVQSIKGGKSIIEFKLFKFRETLLDITLVVQ